MPLKLTGLWRNPDFLKLWSAETISLFGSLVSRTVLPFTAILALEATPWQMALLGAADLVPGILFGLFAGAWVDRLRRRPIMIGADVCRALLLSSIPLAAYFGVLHIEQLYIVAFLAGICTVFFDVAYLSYLPSLVRPEELVEGNSKLAASGSVAEVGAFALAGWLVQWLTAPVAVFIDAFSFLWSAALVGLIRAREGAPGPSAQSGGIWWEVTEGLRVFRSDPLLRGLAASTLIVNVSFHVIGTVYLLFASRELGFDPGILGMIFAVGGASSFSGAVVAPSMTKRLGIGSAMIGGLLFTGVALLFVPLAQGATVMAALLLLAQQVLGDGATVVYEMNQVSLRQAITPDRFQGRINATMQFVGQVASLMGSLGGGLLGEALGLRPTLMAGACGVFLAAVGLALSPVRALRSFPRPLDAAEGRA